MHSKSNLNKILLFNFVKHELNKTRWHSFCIFYAGIHPGNRTGQSGYVQEKARHQALYKSNYANR